MPNAVDHDIILDIPSGANFSTVVALLRKHGAIDRAWPFVLLARINGDHRRVKAGEFRVTARATPRQILDTLVSGEPLLYSVTFIEGWTFQRALAELRKHPRLRCVTAGWSDQEIMTALGEGGLHPEGRFYPDTYYFPAHISDLDLLGIAFRKMHETLAREWNERDPDLALPDAEAALILASVIEKESGAGEQYEISGVFHRRLAKRMLLQADATVIYGLGDGFDGDLRRPDLRNDGPYNTYVRFGLPPTPIALPSGLAINAAMHPASGDSLYFVARGDGRHQFSATLGEHERAVSEYQRRQ